MERQGRILAVFLLLFLGFAAVALRLVQLQIVKRANLAARAERQQQRMVKLDPRRGTIYDRNGTILAQDQSTADGLVRVYSDISLAQTIGYPQK